MPEDDATARVDVPCEMGPDIGAAPLLLLLLDATVVILDDVDRFRALGGMSDSLGAGSCSLSNFPIAGLCTTYKKNSSAFTPSQAGQQYLMSPNSFAHLVRKPIENLLVVFRDEP